MTIEQLIHALPRIHALNEGPTLLADFSPALIRRHFDNLARRGGHGTIRDAARLSIRSIRNGRNEPILPDEQGIAAHKVL
jgi:hypothetical protein